MYSTLARYINNWMYPQPPERAIYGFRWQAGQGVPNQLSIYDLDTDLQPGVYVGFPPPTLDVGADPFGRLPPAPGTVFVAPANPSAEMTALINRVKQNPPPNQGYLFTGVTAQRLSDLTGFLTYTATCLDIINHTTAGAQLFTNINGTPYTVTITPSNWGGNQTFAGDVNYSNTFTDLISDYISGQPMPVQQLLDIINQRYAATKGMQARFNQLAADMNQLPLCSLFQPVGAIPNFLWGQFRFRNQRLTGQNLMNWLSPAGFPAFDQNLRTLPKVFLGISIREAFLVAMAIVLYPAVPPGQGTGAGIVFNVRNEDNNVLGGPGFRPPAIGLAHELMHAMHYTHGTAPGAELRHFTTTAAELLFTGIGPFANEPVTENAVRALWATIPAAAIDPSNVWAVPALRTVYDLPLPPNTAVMFRAEMKCI